MTLIVCLTSPFLSYLKIHLLSKILRLRRHHRIMLRNQHPRHIEEILRGVHSNPERTHQAPSSSSY